MKTSTQASIVVAALGFGLPSLVHAAAPAVAAAPAEPAIEGQGPGPEYLRLLHGKVHARWTDNFLRMADSQLPKTHAVNDPSRRVMVEAVLSPTGEVKDLRVRESSGLQEFDATALEILKDAAPFPAAPEAVLSDDNQVHVVWAFARDHRRCSGVETFQKESPIEEAVPRLVELRRDGEALRRLREVTGVGTPDPGLALFARSWLKRALVDRPMAIPAAAALANAGDASGLEILKNAVKKQEQIGLTAPAMAKLQAPLCPLVKDRLFSPNMEAKGQAAAILRHGAGAECVAALVDLAQNRSAPQPHRLAAIEALGTSMDGAARVALATLSEEGSATIRAAALLASVRPGAGRGTLYKLSPLLRDPSLEIRAAASAGIVRAVGDAGLDQLYLLWKETDARPYEWTALELSKLTSAASAEFLGKYLRKQERRIRVAGAAALAARKDAAARKELASLANDQDLELKMYAAVALDAGARQGLAVAVGPGGRAAYTVLVQGAGRPAAATWVLQRFDTLDGPTKAQLLGEWLAGARVASPVAASAR